MFLFVPSHSSTTSIFDAFQFVFVRYSFDCRLGYFLFGCISIGRSSWFLSGLVVAPPRSSLIMWYFFMSMFCSLISLSMIGSSSVAVIVSYFLESITMPSKNSGLPSLFVFLDEKDPCIIMWSPFVSVVPTTGIILHSLSLIHIHLL